MSLRVSFHSRIEPKEAAKVAKETVYGSKSHRVNKTKTPRQESPAAIENYAHQQRAAEVVTHLKQPNAHLKMMCAVLGISKVTQTLGAERSRNSSTNHFLKRSPNRPGKNSNRRNSYGYS